jgi:hypothetical protein
MPMAQRQGGGVTQEETAALYSIFRPKLDADQLRLDRPTSGLGLQGYIGYPLPPIGSSGWRSQQPVVATVVQRMITVPHALTSLAHSLDPLAAVAPVSRRQQPRAQCIAMQSANSCAR